MSIASTATAVAIGGALSAAGSIGGAVIAGKGASAQAKAAEQSSQTAIAEQQRQFDITQKNLQPWMTAGSEAIQKLQFLLGIGVPPDQAITHTAQTTGIPPDQLNQMMNRGGGQRYGLDGPDGSPYRTDMAMTTVPTPGTATASGPPSGMNAGDFGSLNRNFSSSDFTTDPGYDFRLSEGAKALERSAASKGSVLAGGTLKALTQYNQNFASNEFSNAYNRFQTNRATKFNQLASIAGLGQTTATQLGNLGSQNAATIGNLTIGGQTAAAAARASGYNAWGNAVGSIGNNLSNWYLLSQMNKQSQPPNSWSGIGL